MLVVYDSLTGQGKRFSEKLGFKSVKITEYIDSDEDIFLLTRSFNFGEIPNTTLQFLDKYHHKVKGLAVSGNRNWGSLFGMAGEKISKLYNIPLVLKYEFSGLEKDVLEVKNWIDRYEGRI